MNEIKTMPTAKKSILLPLGIMLVLVGIVAPTPLMRAAQSMGPGTLKSISFISTDILRLCFFAGLICAIIGFLRNRKLKRKALNPNDAQ